jgi:hypothetical protein
MSIGATGNDITVHYNLVQEVNGNPFSAILGVPVNSMGFEILTDTRIANDQDWFPTQLNIAYNLFIDPSGFCISVAPGISNDSSIVFNTNYCFNNGWNISFLDALMPAEVANNLITGNSILLLTPTLATNTEYTYTYSKTNPVEYVIPPRYLLDDPYKVLMTSTPLFLEIYSSQFTNNIFCNGLVNPAAGNSYTLAYPTNPTTPTTYLTIIVQVITSFLAWFVTLPSPNTNKWIVGQTTCLNQAALEETAWSNAQNTYSIESNAHVNAQLLSGTNGFFDAATNVPGWLNQYPVNVSQETSGGGNSGLSGGDIAGIVIGSVAGGFLLIGLGVYATGGTGGGGLVAAPGPTSNNRRRGGRYEGGDDVQLPAAYSSNRNRVIGVRSNIT